jgi:hypothetical protein
MKSFLIQPFGARIGITSKPSEFAAWWNKYAVAKDKMDLKFLDKCRGMAATIDDRPVAPLFVLYMPVGYELTTAFHEALHMAHFLMDYFDSPINLESTDLQAYLMEHIVEKILEKVK